MTPLQRKALQGISLKTMVDELVALLGWSALCEQITIKCFCQTPSVNSSLKFLRLTPWAREKVEQFYYYKFYTRGGKRKP